MKHTKKCRRCNVPLVLDKNFTIVNSEHSMYICQLCIPTELKQRRMYVNGKYISKKHPLYKPGRFKTFEGAAFSALEGYEKTSEGYVYIISNPCWDGWIKVGMAVDAKDRCNQYQTSSPFRDYKLCYNRKFKDRKSAEQKAHSKLKKISTKHKGEWFKVSVNEATKLIEAI